MIDSEAFEDLVSVQQLYLYRNRIETLDKKLFVTMVKMEGLHLDYNKIITLSPLTFQIPRGPLKTINLKYNVCINKEYESFYGSLAGLEPDLSAKCAADGGLAQNIMQLKNCDIYLLITAVKNVFCELIMMDSLSSQLSKSSTCQVEQAIDHEDYVLGSDFSTAVEQFLIRNDEEVKFLPRYVGERFPNLKEFMAVNCGLTVVRSHYFKNMRNLLYLFLFQNKIVTIEPDAFNDLVSVNQLYIYRNLIETLDEKMFAFMVSLAGLHLDYNKIKHLSPETLVISGGKLRSINLNYNVCISKEFDLNNWDQLENDLRARCS